MEPAPQAPAALCREPHGDAGAEGLASLVRRRMRVDDRLSAERNGIASGRRDLRARTPSRRHGSHPGGPKFGCTEEKFSLSTNLILNPIEKELRVRRQKMKIKTGEEEHAEVLRTCFKENVC